MLLGTAENSAEASVVVRTAGLVRIAVVGWIAVVVHMAAAEHTGVVVAHISVAEVGRIRTAAVAVERAVVVQAGRRVAVGPGADGR